jgi:hypothetical protein
MGKKLSLIFIICVPLTALVWANNCYYYCTVIADGPLSYWRFEDADSNDGAVCADTMCDYYPVCSPGVYRNVTLVPGIVGKAAQFHGTGEGGSGSFVQIPDSAYSSVPYRLESSPNCTVEFWMKTSPTAEETYGRFISHANGGTTNYWVGMTTVGSNPGQPFIGVPGGTWYASPPILADGEWHHVVVTYTYNDPNTTTELWIDGLSRGTHTVTGVLTPPGDWQDLLLGAEGNPYYVYNGYVGLLDEVAYYDYVLSDEQILWRFILSPPYCYGNINNDCKVDFKDFAEFASSEPPYDIDILAEIVDYWLVEY